MRHAVVPADDRTGVEDGEEPLVRGPDRPLCSGRGHWGTDGSAPGGRMPTGDCADLPRGLSRFPD
jgi:hypothetical protein